jgi:hypothetical protein
MIASLNASGKRRLTLDIVVTTLSTLVSAIPVQSNNLALLPSGLIGVAFSMLGVAIISIANSYSRIATLRVHVEGVTLYTHAPLAYQHARRVVVNGGKGYE